MILALLFQTLIQITPDHIAWKPALPPLPKGSEYAVLTGKVDAATSVPFTLRLKLPAGAAIERQSARADQYVTVLSGDVNVTIGKEAASHFPAGSFFIVPFGVQHSIAATEDSVLQVSGIGTWYSLQENVTVKDAWIEVVEIAPAPKSPINGSTILHAVLRYSIRNFKEDRFRIMPMFESTSGMTFAVPNRTPLTAASGTFEIAYPMVQIFSNPQLRKPVQVWFIINELIDTNRSRTIAATPGISYDVK